MMYDLPTALEIDEVMHEIRSDFRVALDINAALNDPDLSETDKSRAVIKMLYPNYEMIRNTGEALKKASWFLACGEDDDAGRTNLKTMDWEQDFKLIIAPINRVLGYEARAIPYDLQTNTGGLHWWTFVAAYYEIGECAFANAVAIRNKLMKGKRLEKWEQEFYRENRKMIDLNAKTSSEEQALIDEIMQNNL